MLRPKRVEAYRQIWLQIKANGYDVIPLAFGRDRPFKGWPQMPNDAASIARWNGRSAAVRMYRSGLLVIDVDVRIAAIADAIVQMLETRWPDFMARCLRRHSGGVKIAFIGRATTDLRYLNTRRCVDPNDPLALGQRVEIFTTNSKTYLGVHGLHSMEGATERHYGYHGRSIVDAPVDSLPVFPAADIGAMAAACEDILLAHGLTPTQPPVPPGGHQDVVYSIDENTRFDVHEGPDQIDYDELCSLYAARGEIRVSSSFFDGGSNRTRCRVGDCYVARCIGVFINGEQVWHCPKDAEPAARAEAIAPLLAEAMAAEGIELPPDLPNWRERTKGGKPIPCMHNAKLAIAAAGLICSEDVFHNRMFIGRGGAASPRDALPNFIGVVDDPSILLLRDWLSDRYGIDLLTAHVRDAVCAMAHANRFNPVVEMLAEVEANWDGVARLDRMAADILNCADTPLNSQCVRKTMVAAVARARVPGCKFDTILVLESPEGWGKSTVWSVLAGEGNFSDERIIGKDSREVQEQLAGIWIHENADLAGMRKAEVETVKAYASRVEDRARPAYGRFLIAQPRHSIEVGTTNNNEYLQSQTGNRRFWLLRVERPIDLAALRRLRLQLWGEAAAAQSAGESLVLDAALWPDAAVEQEARRVRDAWEDDLAELSGALAGAGLLGGVVTLSGDEERVSSRAIFEYVLKVPPHIRDDRHAKRLANAMRVLGWTSGLIRIDGVPVRGYYRKVKVAG